jgi:alpha-mannosidase
MSPPIPVIIVPHTHWDREWYEPEARFRQRLVEMLDAALERLETEDGAFLLDGQTVLLEDYLAVRPEQASRIEALVHSGKLVAGPWYVLADELLSSDETLVRNLLVGRWDGRRWGGWMPVGYSPDAFGHPAALPTILAGFGIEHGVVLRGYGGEQGQEKDLFRWVGPDGSVVLTYHFPPAGFEIAVNLPEDPAALAGRWEEMRATLEARAAAPVLMAMNGADHHALQPRIGSIVARLNELAPGYDFQLGSPADYFAALPDAVEAPEVRGELRFSPHYSWMLQGALSARARLKQAIAEGERLLLRWAEPQTALARIDGGPDRRPLLQAAWREHLRNCFHDTVCGTTSDEVARDAATRARRVTTEARGILLDALHDRLGQDRALARHREERWQPTLVVLNPAARSLSGVVEATLTVPRRRLVIGRPAAERKVASEWPAPPVLVDAAGVPVPMQVLYWYRGYHRLDSPADYPIQHEVAAFRVAIEVRDVPALGMSGFAARKGEPCEVERHRVWVSGRRRAAADWGDVGTDSVGGFALRDRSVGREYPQLASIVSERDEGDSYTFQPVEGDRPRGARWSTVREAWGGPLVAAVARDFEIRGRACGTVYARLDAGSTLVRFVVEGVNLAGNHRLRIHFPLPDGSSRTQSVADSQYGPVWHERQDFDRREFRREWPVDTVPLHRYVSVPGGLTVLARGLYEYELTADGTVAVTLLRAVGELSRGELEARPGHAGWPTATPEAQQLGAFRAELAITTRTVDAGSGASEWAELERLAEEFHAPLAGLMLPYGIGVPDSVEGPALSGVGLVLKAVKPSESGDALVLRCANVTERRVSGAWTIPFEIDRAHRARLDETRLREIVIPEEGQRIPFEAAPREVVTILVEPLPLVEVD